MGIRIGLVGLGSFGSEFAELFYAHPQVSRVALCDREPERIARFAERDTWRGKLRPGDTYADLESICRADLDALAIITQPWLHAPQCIAAMESGKHVYSAVPVISIPDGDAILEWCDRVIETTRRTGSHYMLGETTFFHADTMYCRRKAAEGAFGSFVYSEGEYYHSFDSPACDLRVVRDARLRGSAGEEWRRQREEQQGAGMLDSPTFYPTHSVSGPFSVMRAHAVKVSAWGTPPATREPFFDRERSPFSNVTALAKMSNGATMRFCEHRECGLIRETFRVYGTEAAYENGVWIQKEAPTALSREQMADPLPDDVRAAFIAAVGEERLQAGHGGSHQYLVHEFVTSVAEGRRPAIDAWEAARYMAVGVAAFRSALRDGETVDVPDWGDPPA